MPARRQNSASTHPPGTHDGRAAARAARRRRTASVSAILVLALTAACTGGVDGPVTGTSSAPAPTAEPSPEPPAALAAEPDGVHALPDADPAALALAASRTFFDSAPVVVVVAADRADGSGADDVAAAAADLVSGPVLVTGGKVEPQDVSAELDRLTAATAVVVTPSADGATADGATADGATADGATADGATTDGATTDSTRADGASTDGVDEVRVAVDDVTDDEGAVDDDALAAALAALPATGEPQRSTGVLALTDLAGAPGSGPAVATARASGATLLEVPGGDPRATSATVRGVHDAVTADDHRATVGIGPAFGEDDDLAPRVTTAATGVELPAGGQLTLPGKRYVALYGAPGVTSLGVLGEQDVDETIARAKRVAAQYDDLSDEPVVPTLEIITTVASGSAGDDGNYSNERSADLVRPYVDAAREAGVYVVLDFQPGRTDFLTQVQQYADLVKEPHVGVALDPEWRLEKDQKHLEQIGHVDVDEVNAVGDWLADLVREDDLPQKTFLLHQFRPSMVAGRERLDTTHPELAVVVHADGQGGQEAKQATWRTLHHDAPDGVWWGWKNFYDEDAPMLTPEQTMQVEPAPDFVSYQ